MLFLDFGVNHGLVFFFESSFITMSLCIAVSASPNKQEDEDEVERLEVLAPVLAFVVTDED